MKKTTENMYIEETIEAVEKVGRFAHTFSEYYLLAKSFSGNYQQMMPFVFSTPDLIRLNIKWKEKLKTERERVRRNLITGSHNKKDDALANDSMEDTVVTLINSTNYNTKIFNSYNPILPVASVISAIYCTQTGIADKYTLNKEQRAAFMIITSHLDRDRKCCTGIFIIYKSSNRNRNIFRLGDNNGQLIMCIQGCGGTYHQSFLLFEQHHC